MKLALHLPINSVSFGQVSTMLLRYLFEQEQAGNPLAELCIFPIGGGADLSSQVVSEDFKNWLQKLVIRAFETHDRRTPCFKLWHLNGSFESFSDKQTLLTFYELDSPTKVEVNVAKNSQLCLSSHYACDVFNLFGVPAKYLPLAFDHYNFKVIPKKFHTDDRVVFNLCGKFEKRKHHAKIIQAWVKKYGKNVHYALQCATFNPFLNEQQNHELLAQVFKGPKPFNVSFYPMMKENAIYNDFLNSADIIIGMSGGEGWGLPEFHSIALGKHAIILNAHSYKSWVDDKMAVLVNPTTKIDAVDNMFFKSGDTFNQGKIFDWDEDSFIAACEQAVERVTANRINTAGLELQKRFPVAAFAEKVISLSI